MPTAVPLHDDICADDLRWLTRTSRNASQSRRLLALAAIYRASWLRTRRTTRLTPLRSLCRFSLNGQLRSVPEGPVPYFESYLGPYQFFRSISSCSCSLGSLASHSEPVVAVELDEAYYIQSNRLADQISSALCSVLEAKHRALPGAPSPFFYDNVSHEKRYQR